MNKVSRRSVLGIVSGVLSAAALGLALPRKSNAAARPADQPHMQAALDLLRNAKGELDQAEPDKGGHRARALDLVSRAIEETRKGVEFARSH
ncbi:MAG TPA: hypothetical protein VEZ90_08540 [Blastocatellia bacterium]|nr:hypothetical protein [Blastocatellia bacterium]